MNHNCLYTGRWEYCQRLDNRSRMSREVHVRFCEGLRVKFPRSTRLVCCFHSLEKAQQFYQDLVQRLKEFNLVLAEEKSRVIPFGRDSLAKAKQPTFDFLGFTHYVGQSKKGHFRIKRKTASKKFSASLRRCKGWLKVSRNKEIKSVMAKLAIKLLGYYRYYGITDNTKALVNFRSEVGKLLFKWMNRRSQRKSFDWEKFNLFLKRYPLPNPKIYVHIYDYSPDLSFCVKMI